MLDVLKQIVQEIIEDADEASSPGESNDVDFGKLLAYTNVLKTIWFYCSEEEREAIGLDFDIEERYF